MTLTIEGAYTLYLIDVYMFAHTNKQTNLMFGTCEWKICVSSPLFHCLRTYHYCYCSWRLFRKI